MFRSIFCLYLLSVVLFTACQQESAAVGEPEQGEESSTAKVADIIRNPVTADEKQVDTTNLARITFAEEKYAFGDVDAGAVINHEFVFTNTGEVPLVISDVRSTCGCTVADWPKEPIAPKETGVIPVRFDTKNKNGHQSKPITITTNAYPSKTVIYLDGEVYGQE